MDLHHAPWSLFPTLFTTIPCHSWEESVKIGLSGQSAWFVLLLFWTLFIMIDVDLNYMWSTSMWLLIDLHHAAWGFLFCLYERVKRGIYLLILLTRCHIIKGAPGFQYTQIPIPRLEKDPNTIVCIHPRCPNGSPSCWAAKLGAPAPSSDKHSNQCWRSWLVYRKNRAKWPCFTWSLGFWVV